MGFIPPISLSESISDIYNSLRTREGRSKLKKKALFAGVFGAIGAFAGTGILYGTLTLSNGTIDYTKWSKIENQREIQAEQETRDYSKKQFHKIDKNNDLIIDSNEFYGYIREGRK